ncbi:hypothetical protein C8Q80DRAFT_1275590 [Daedaleopsis nitida]|nr:hypothetical protein C8Q80DRAFT_1275590 [Daedaleopsis nitida]
MSSIDDTVIALYGSLAVSRYCSFAVIALSLFDYSLTLRREVELFWKAKLTVGALLFFLPRYMILVVVSADIWAISCALSDKRFYIPWAVFSGLRSFALSGNRPFSFVVFALSVVPFGLNMLVYGYGLRGQQIPLIGCSETVSMSPALQSRSTYASRCYTSIALKTHSLLVTIASRTCVITADALVVFITWFSLVRGRDKIGPTRSSLTSVMLHNGTLYFVALLLLNIFCITLSLLPNYVSKGYTNLTIFVEPLAEALVARFLLDLQEAKLRPLKLASNDPLCIPADTNGAIPSFVSPILGSTSISDRGLVHGTFNSTSDISDPYGDLDSDTTRSPNSTMGKEIC